MLHRFIGSLFLSRLFSTPSGRAFQLGFMADAEESDEGHVFDELIARVDDPDLGKLVRLHRADEERHAIMLRGAALRQGVPIEPVPTELRFILRIDRHLGGFSKKFVGGRAGVMEAYVLLQVIEERAVREFPAIVRELEKVDPESAKVVDKVLHDEERHVKYAQAISRRYAPDLVTLEKTLASFRRVEARAFEEQRIATVKHAYDRGLLSGGSWIERGLWRSIPAEPGAIA